MSSAESAGDLLGELVALLGVEVYRREEVQRQAQRLRHIMLAMEEKVLLEDPMPLHGMVSRYEGP
jgi:hypothetical protein